MIDIIRVVSIQENHSKRPAPAPAPILTTSDYIGKYFNIIHPNSKPLRNTINESGDIMNITIYNGKDTYQYPDMFVRPVTKQ